MWQWKYIPYRKIVNKFEYEIRHDKVNFVDFLELWCDKFPNIYVMQFTDQFLIPRIIKAVPEEILMLCSVIWELIFQIETSIHTGRLNKEIMRFLYFS